MPPILSLTSPPPPSLTHPHPATAAATMLSFSYGEPLEASHLPPVHLSHFRSTAWSHEKGDVKRAGLVSPSLLWILLPPATDHQEAPATALFHFDFKLPNL